MNIPINKLRYDFFDWTDTRFPKAFAILEKTLPVIPEQLEWFVNNYYKDLLKIYHSIYHEGLKKPLDVIKLADGTYRTRIGNQRLVCIKAQKKLKEVPCNER